MKINRKELKANAKTTFKTNYACCVIVAILMSLLALGITLNANFSNVSSAGTVTSVNYDASYSSISQGISQSNSAGALNMFAGVSAITALVVFLVNLFVLKPLKVGGYSFFLKNNHEKAKLGELLYAFKNNYANSVVALLLQEIFLCLWTLLFIIPGIVKSYSYAMVPFLLADNPELQATEVITKSRQMMDGYKWQAFVLDLSFIGWEILSAITCGLVGVFYVNPYVFQTKAELYEFLKEQSQAPTSAKETPDSVTA